MRDRVGNPGCSGMSAINSRNSSGAAPSAAVAWCCAWLEAAWGVAPGASGAAVAVVFLHVGQSLMSQWAHCQMRLPFF